MNDMTYAATVLDAHRAADVRRDAETLVRRAEREEQRLAASASLFETAPAAASVVRPRSRATWLHRPARRSASVVTR